MNDEIEKYVEKNKHKIYIHQGNNEKYFLAHAIDYNTILFFFGKTYHGRW